MTRQSYKDFMKLVKSDLTESTLITAPCCGRTKPIFAMRDRDSPPTEKSKKDQKGFMCDSCTVEGARVVEALAAAFNPKQDWDVVRYDRDQLMIATDSFENERIRKRMKPEKLKAMDEYRKWLLDITDNYTDAKEASAALADRQVPK